MKLVRVGVLLLALAAVLATGAFVRWKNPRLQRFGTCSTATNGPDFNIHKLLEDGGVWYEISRLDNEFEEHTDCNMLQLYIDPNGGDEPFLAIDFVAHYMNHTQGTRTVLARVVKNNDEVVITYSPDDNSAIEKLVVLATDYHNYTILYSCAQLDSPTLPKKEEKAWILSNKQYFDKPIQDIVDNYLSTSSDDFVTFLTPINTVCKPGC